MGIPLDTIGIDAIIVIGSSGIPSVVAAAGGIAESQGAGDSKPSSPDELADAGAGGPVRREAGFIP
jgi:hypothetical protein